MKDLKVIIPPNQGQGERIEVGALKEGQFKDITVTIRSGEKIGVAEGEIMPDGTIEATIRTDADIGSLFPKSSASLAYAVDFDSGEVELESIGFIPFAPTTKKR